ncbi:MAG: hypothetical protein UU86_C0021G0011 [candidate division WWE3 bacterium GW2011_GWC1_42_102]|nr:MAG: hypothetical protein UU86_C0021G0011 [candidate division WWE3 bacterium GW2011_GWC1_42_102]
MNKESIREIINVLNSGGVAFFKSDTVYGLHTKTENNAAAEKIRQIKGRDGVKPFIILIGNTDQLKKFGVLVNKNTHNLIKKYWPGKLTVVLNVNGGTQAFRMPKDKYLQEILKATGPLVSTSANPSGEKPAANIEEAKTYFGEQIDLYVNSGAVESAPSTIVDCTGDKIKILREGEVKLSPQQTKSYNSNMGKVINYVAAAAIFVAVTAGVWLNVAEQKSVDHSKLPDKVEQSIGFQRWITNLKNKDMFIEADEFTLKEENEIYNTKWMKVGYAPNEVHFYGLKEDKIIDARILDCSAHANCYFDRAYFLDNDVFVISEFSRTIDKKDVVSAACSLEETCEYSVKVHVIDLINNKRLVYESKPFQAVMTELMPEL